MQPKLSGGWISHDRHDEHADRYRALPRAHRRGAAEGAERDRLPAKGEPTSARRDRRRPRHGARRQPPRRSRDRDSRPGDRLHARGELRQRAARDRGGAEAHRRRNLRRLHGLWEADRARAAGIPAMGDALRRRRAEPGLSEQRTADVRMGSSTDALTPISVATRSLAARWPQWIALGLVVTAAVLADQVTKHIVATQLSLDEQVPVLGPFSIHHVQNSG